MERPKALPFAETTRLVMALATRWHAVTWTLSHILYICEREDVVKPFQIPSYMLYMSIPYHNMVRFAFSLLFYCVLLQNFGRGALLEHGLPPGDVGAQGGCLRGGGPSEPRGVQ